MYTTSLAAPSSNSSVRLPKGFHLLEESVPTVTAEAVEKALSPLLGRTITFSSSAIEQLAALKEELSSWAVRLDHRATQAPSRKEFLDECVMRLLKEVQSLSEFERTLHASTIFSPSTLRKAC